MEYLLITLLFPLVVPWVSKVFFPHEIQLHEIAMSVAVGCVITTIVYFVSLNAQTHDVEIWNGEVLSKSQEQVSCSHSYSCNCRTDSKGHTTCDTCYEHSHDYDWMVYTNVGNIEIDRVDRQGEDEPPRWRQVKIGEPVAKEHNFTNYVKAVPESLFHQHDVNKFVNLIPPYPSSVHDYYKLRRTITMGVNVPDLLKWDEDLAQALKALGPSKQANIIVLFVNTNDQSYIHALEGKWIGGKKNDIIVVVGTTQYPKIDWVAVSSWTDAQLFKVQLRDDLYAHGIIDRTAFVKTIYAHTAKSFKRKSMKDFKYLEQRIEPPTWALVLGAIAGVLVSFVVSFWLSQSSGGSFKYRRKFY